MAPRPLLAEAFRRRRHRDGPSAANLLHLERALGDAVAAEAERAVDPRKAAIVAQPGLGEGGARLPVPPDPPRQQHDLLAARRQPLPRRAGPRPVFPATMGTEAVQHNP